MNRKRLLGKEPACFRLGEQVGLGFEASAFSDPLYSMTYYISGILHLCQVRALQRRSTLIHHLHTTILMLLGLGRSTDGIATKLKFGESSHIR